MSPAEQLAALAERELAAAVERRTDDLLAIAAVRDELLATLPADRALLGPADLDALRRAAATQHLAGEALRAALAATRAELAGATRTQTAASAYRRSTDV